MLHIGFDIGGTNMKAGIINADMQILAQQSRPYPPGGDHEQIVALMAELVYDLAKELNVPIDQFKTLGVAIAGSIDSTGGQILHAYNLGLHHMPMKALIQQKFPQMPVYLANDADAAALGELYAGAFRGCKTAVLLTLGTGLGGGLILNGRIFKGGKGNGLELGHMILQHDGPICTCGNRGCAEVLCTATWLITQGRRSVIDLPLGLIYQKAQGSPDAVTAKLVVDCAKEGDQIALDIFYRYVDALSSMIASCIAFLDPEAVALGGGVSLAGDFLFTPLRRKVEEKSFLKVPHQVVPAELGYHAGMIGAALLHRND